MSPWLSGHVIANGIRLHYHRTGGARPPLVLLHGITDSGLCWTRLARALEADYDLVMVDARGHGLSEVPESGYTPAHQAADVAGLIAALGLERPVLIGHSMGANTAAETAATYPECVGAVVLEDPPWRDWGVQGAELVALMAEWRARILDRRSKTAEELLALCQEEHPEWADVEFAPWVQAKQQVSPRVAEGAGGPHIPWQETARRIACPALLVTADVAAGAIVTPQVAQEAAGLMRNGSIAHIPGAGHNIRREQFDAFVAAVRPFLAEL